MNKEKIFQRWQENEMDIILKAYNSSIKDKDYERANSLKKTLLDLEKHSKNYENISEKSSEEENQNQEEDKKGENEIVKENVKEGEAKENGNLDIPHTKSTNSTGLSKVEEEQISRMLSQNFEIFDKKITATVIGESGTGKTKFINNILDINEGKDSFKSPFGGYWIIRVECKSKLIQEKGIKVRYRIYEGTINKLEFNLKKLYFQRSDLIIIIFDLGIRKSFDSAIEWIGKIRKEFDIVNKRIVLLGNLRLPNIEPIVTTAMRRNVVKTMYVEYYEISENSKPEEIAILKEKIFQISKLMNPSSLKSKDYISKEKVKFESQDKNKNRKTIKNTLKSNSNNNEIFGQNPCTCIIC